MTGSCGQSGRARCTRSTRAPLGAGCSHGQCDPTLLEGGRGEEKKQISHHNSFNGLLRLIFVVDV